MFAISGFPLTFAPWRFNPVTPSLTRGQVMTGSLVLFKPSEPTSPCLRCMALQRACTVDFWGHLQPGLKVDGFPDPGLASSPCGLGFLGKEP